MPKVVYLWNSYTTKRHIKDPSNETVTHNGDPISLCKFFFETRKEQERHFKKHYTGKVAKEHIARMDNVPLCLKCQKTAIKLGLMEAPFTPTPAPEPVSVAYAPPDVGTITVRVRH
jgi:hypothetical protein